MAEPRVLQLVDQVRGFYLPYSTQANVDRIVALNRIEDHLVCHGSVAHLLVGGSLACGMAEEENGSDADIYLLFGPSGNRQLYEAGAEQVHSHASTILTGMSIEILGNHDGLTDLNHFIETAERQHVEKLAQLYGILRAYRSINTRLDSLRNSLEQIQAVDPLFDKALEKEMNRADYFEFGTRQDWVESLSKYHQRLSVRGMGIPDCQKRREAELIELLPS